MSEDSYNLILSHVDDNGEKDIKELGQITDLNLTKDGEYEIVVKAKDMYGNENIAEKRLIIDKSAPMITGLEEYDGRYLKELSLKEKIGEMIYDKHLFKLRTYLNGQEYDFNNAIKSSGHYVLSVMAMDEAGNRAYKQAEFVIKDENDSLNNTKAEAVKAVSVNSLDKQNTEENVKLIIDNGEGKKSNYRLLLALSAAVVCAILTGIIIIRKLIKKIDNKADRRSE